MAMASRTELLERLVTALSRPGVDGLLATADIAEDLLLLGALEDKLVFASINRGGLQGSAFEMDDRNTGYDVQGTIESGFDGAKMLTRIDLDDPGTVATLERCGTGGDRAQPGRADRHGRAVHVQPGGTGKIVNDLSPDAVIKSMHIAQGLGASSAYTWLKLPVVARDGAGDGRHHAADAAAGRRPGRRRRTRRTPPGRPRCSCRRSAAWSSAAPCSTRPTTTWPRRSTPPSPWCDERSLIDAAMSSTTCPPAARLAGPYDLEVTPESAGWGYSSPEDHLAARGGHRRLRDRGRRGDRGAAVRRRLGRGRRVPRRPRRPGRRLRRADRRRLRAGIGQTVTLHSERRRPVRALRGPRPSSRCRCATCRRPRCRWSCAGRASPAGRCATSAPRTRCRPSKIIACEVITPGGNWSSYPAHKHDEATRARVRAGGDLLLRDRRRPGRRAGPGLLPDLVLARQGHRHPRRGPRSRHGAGARTAGTDRLRRGARVTTCTT